MSIDEWRRMFTELTADEETVVKITIMKVFEYKINEFDREEI